ncbi:MAG: substrate-binding domain-containing protein, partial [Muribaculaceae bacterium]|nr:substrate-binding domain-containing protein [Muribaculaceae bacterium]
VLAGRDSLWNELWPADGLGKINVYFDHGGSSTVQYMQDKVLDGKKFGARVYAKGSVPEVFKAVENDKNGLGIVGVSWLTTDMAKADLPDSERKALTAELAAQAKSDEQIEAPRFTSAIKVLNVRRDNEMDAYKPYQQYIYDGRYPFTRQIFMCTTAVGGSLGGGFYSYVTGWDGQKIISLTGIMPARVKARIVELGQ